MTIIGALALVALPVAWSASAARSGRVAMPNRIDLPSVAGWTRVSMEGPHPWFPRFEGADHRLLGRYADEKGRWVDLAIILYAWQDEGRELIGFGQGAADRDNGWTWTNDVPAPPGARAEHILTEGPIKREVVSFYRVGGTTTGSAARVKLETMKARLSGAPQYAVAVLIASEEISPGSAREAISRFLAAVGSVDQLADGVAQRAMGG